MGELMHWKRSSSVSHYRAVGTWGQGDGINPISSRGQIMPITLLFLPPPVFSEFPTALHYSTQRPTQCSRDHEYLRLKLSHQLQFFLSWGFTELCSIFNIFGPWNFKPKWRSRPGRLNNFSKEKCTHLGLCLKLLQADFIILFLRYSFKEGACILFFLS